MRIDPVRLSLIEIRFLITIVILKNPRKLNIKKYTHVITAVIIDT